MLKKLAAFTGASLLSLAGCGVETKTFLATDTAVPADDEDPNASQDFDGDGDIDNQLPALANALDFAAGIDLQTTLNDAIIDGAVLIAADVSSKNFADDDKKAAVEAYLANTADGAAPKLDGTDTIVVGGDGSTFPFNEVLIAGGVVTTGQSNFVFALPLDPANPTLLPFNNAKFTGNVSGDAIANGSLSGVIGATDFAAALGSIGALVGGLVLTASEDANAGTAVPCGGAAAATDDAFCAGLGGAVVQTCTDNDSNAVATGFCVDPDSGANTALGLVDQPPNAGDGVITVEFDAANGVFITNELALIFDLDATGQPVGAVGGLFNLDLVGGDGNRDSMPLGILFNGKLATRQ